MDPSVVVIRDRLRDIFPEIKIPPEIIGWHIRQSTTSDLSASIETICSTFAAEILSFGQVVDPMKNHRSNEASVASSSSSSSSSTTTTTVSVSASAATSDELQTLYDVFNAIPREHVKNVYDRLKNGSEATNPHWHEDVINELLVYSTPNSLPSKKRLQDAMETNDQQDEHEFVSEEYDRFLAVLPDIDPDYAFECYMNFLQTTSSHGDLNTLITSLIERGYTKIQDTLERTRNERLKENLRQPPFEIEDFLKTFPEPLVYFYDQTKNVTESYKNHAFIYLANAFSRVPNDHIRKVLVDNKHRFAPAMKQLKEEFSTYHYSRSNKRHISNNAHGENTHKRLNHRARASIAIPDVPDEIFYKDLCYTKHEDEIIGKWCVT